MKPKTLGIFVVVALVMAGVVLVLEREVPSTDERREQAKKVLGSTLDAEGVTALSLSFNDQTIRLEKHQSPAASAHGEEANEASVESSWRLVEPMDTAADADRVETLIDRLLSLEKKRTVESADVAASGLDAPRVTAVLETASGSRQLAIGDALPLSDDVLMIDPESGEVFQVAAIGDLVEVMTQAAGDWRDPTLFPASRKQIRTIQLSAPGAAEIRLARRGDSDSFDLEDPIVDRADAQLVNVLLNTVSTLEAATFLEPSAAVSMTDAGSSEEIKAAEVTAEIDGRAQPWRLELWLPQDAVLDGELLRARYDGQLVEIEAPTLPGILERPAEGWRSTTWSGLQVFDIDRATLTMGDRAFEIVREKGEWRRDGEPIDYALASDALYPLVESRAVEIRPTKDPIESSSPELVVELRGGDGATERLSLYPTVDGLAPATVDGRPVVLMLDAADAAKVLAKVESLGDADPLDKPTP